MLKIAAALTAAWLVAGAALSDDRPRRIVSLNLCADQILVLLVERERIAAVTRLSSDPHSSASVEALAGLRTVAGSAEDVFALGPDLVLAGTYTARPAVTLLQRLGVRVVELPPETSLADIPANIEAVGAAVGEPERAAALVAAFDAELASLRAEADEGRGVFADIQINGWVSGAGTLTADVVHAAGYETLGEALGWAGARQVSLEQLLISSPDALALGDAWDRTPALAGERLRHPALARLMATRTVADVPEPLWACGGLFTLEAVRRIVAAGRAEAP